jgi:hypothetical protein
MKEYPVEGARLGDDSDDEGAMLNVGGPQEVLYGALDGRVLWQDRHSFDQCTKYT